MWRGLLGTNRLSAAGRTEAAGSRQRSFLLVPPSPDTPLPAADPCQSTGVWYVEPTPVGIRFMAAMRDRLLHPSMRRQWDQAAWNEGASLSFFHRGHKLQHLV